MCWPRGNSSTQQDEGEGGVVKQKDRKMNQNKILLPKWEKTPFMFDSNQWNAQLRPCSSKENWEPEQKEKKLKGKGSGGK